MNEGGEQHYSDEHIAACVSILIAMPIDEFQARCDAIGLTFTGPHHWGQ